MKKSFLLYILIWITLGVQALPYKVSYLTADDGLSRNFVYTIFKDSRGYMWFGTSKGLDRYDGYDFVHFNSTQRDNPLPSDVVVCMMEDNNGDLWIGTENGLYFMNFRTGAIQSAAEKLNHKQRFLANRINFIEKDEAGQLWIGHTQGLSVITTQAGKAYSIDDVYSSTTVVALLIFNNIIYIAENNNVSRIVKSNSQKYHRINSEAKLKNLSGDVNALFFDNGFIWIGTTAGLYRYDPATEALAHFTHHPFLENTLSSNSIIKLNRNNEGQLLVGTFIGLNIYDYITNQFSRITSEKTKNGISLNNNFVSSIFVDDQTVWIGTEKGGVNILFPDQNLFANFQHSPEQPGSLSKNPVNAIYTDTDGDLWVGTVEGGLNFKKKGTDQFLHYTAQPNNPRSLSHNSVSSICQDFRGDYWIGTWGYGINYLNKKDKNRPVFTQYWHDASSGNSISSNLVAAIVSDAQNNGIWIGSREGLDFLDVETRRFYRLLGSLPYEKALRFITGLYIDVERRLWAGTSNGLFCIDLNETDIRKSRVSYEHFHYELSNPASQRIEKINCILQTKDQRLWFGSNGNGMYLLEEKKGAKNFIRFDESTGLTDNVIYGLLEDETGTIWLSTDKGLCAFNPDRNSIRNFTVTDGLISNQFYWDAYFKDDEGKMYFGSVGGLTVFDPLKHSPRNVLNRVSITRVTVLNENIFPPKLNKSEHYLHYENASLKRINLRESDKTFSIEFSALNFYMADKIKYAYRLKGFDNTWKEVSADRRFANFTNIKYGKYDFEVKCTNADGTWSDETFVLEIRVVPPFYKKWWFITLMVALIIYITYTYSIYRIRLLKKQELLLRKLVDERTHEIEEQKERLEHQATQLQENMHELLLRQEEVSRQNEVLTKQNQKITRQKDQLVELSEKVQEATLDKIAFFTNITHEFRTPITLILGPVERALKLSTNPKVLEQLHIVRRNSKLLLSLINQLMDFRKVESGKMELTKTNQNFVEFLDEIILPFEDLAKDRGVVFRKQYRVNPPEFLFDRDNMQKVMGNLLSNALKFTPDRGTITVIASTFTDKSDHKERLYVAVKDSGNGIPEVELERIFERFYQSKQNVSYSGYGQSGTGIGLFLCHKIIGLHNGKIEALNLQNGGACFRFIIPIERRLTTMVSVDGKAEMLVAQPDENDPIDSVLKKNKPVLLIVEDNSDMRQYIRSILSGNYNVLEAPNGLVGLELTKRYQPDLIISDIMMPEMDGMEFCKRVKSDFTTSHIPVILLTAKSGTSTQIESFHSGADAFLVKPFDEDLLVAIIKNLNEKRKGLQMSFAESMDANSLNIEDESQDKKFIDKALKVIKDNYTNSEFDVSEFIDAMGISRSLLHKKLKNIAGQSASRFIRIYRLTIARELIIKNRASHSLNISEIAYEVGFNDPKYFTRCFTKHFGIQPSAFLEESDAD